MTTAGMHWAALGWQVGLAFYMQLVSWVPLGRWNYQPCCPTGLEQFRRGTLAAGDALGAAAFVLPLLVYWWGRRQGLRTFHSDSAAVGRSLASRRHAPRVADTAAGGGGQRQLDAVS